MKLKSIIDFIFNEMTIKATKYQTYACLSHQQDMVKNSPF